MRVPVLTSVASRRRTRASTNPTLTTSTRTRTSGTAAPTAAHYHTAAAVAAARTATSGGTITTTARATAHNQTPPTSRQFPTPMTRGPDMAPVEVPSNERRPTTAAHAHHLLRRHCDTHTAMKHRVLQYITHAVADGASAFEASMIAASTSFSFHGLVCHSDADFRLPTSCMQNLSVIALFLASPWLRNRVKGSGAVHRSPHVSSRDSFTTAG